MPPEGTDLHIVMILSALQTYGAVVGSTSSTGFAYIDAEATYVDNPGDVWDPINEDSLQVAPLQDYHFVRHGEIADAGSGYQDPSYRGPHHDEWAAAGGPLGTGCEADPGG